MCRLCLCVIVFICVDNEFGFLFRCVVRMIVVCMLCFVVVCIICGMIVVGVVIIIRLGI